MTRRLFPFLGLLALAGCGDLPQPFAGNPGANALRLAAPPPPRLDVPLPTDALLGNRQAALWTRLLVAELAGREVPAVAQPRRKGDWSLAMSATLDGDMVIPRFAVLGPDNRVRANREGTPVPAADWSAIDPSLTAAHAAAAAATISAMLTDLQTSTAHTDPNSLLNRSTRVLFEGVSGAPGNGDAALAEQMRQLLPDEHTTLQTDRSHADYLVSGRVAVSKPDNNVQHVEITWTVTRTVVGSEGRPAHEAGKATQLHDLPARSLDGEWGDIAAAAAGEAANGVHEVINNNEGRGKPGNGSAAHLAATPGARSADQPLVAPPLAAPPDEALPPPRR